MFFKSRIKAKDLVFFSHQFSSLLSIGVPIVESLSMVIDCIRGRLKEILTSVRDDIKSGIPMSEAVSKHPQVFTKHYISMVRAGEVSNILDIVLKYPSDYLENADKLKSKMQKTLLWPMAVLIIGTSVIIFLLMEVVPTLKNIVAAFGNNPPFLTVLLCDASDFLNKYFFDVLLSSLVVCIIFFLYRKIERGRFCTDRLLLKLPIFGVLLRRMAEAKLVRTLSLLVKNGVPVIQALGTAAKTSGNQVVEKSVPM